MKIVGPYTSPTIYSEHPGIVELTSSDPSVASVDASVVIPGTRVYGNMGRGGDYLARAGSDGNGRSSVTLFIKLDTSKALPMTKGSAIGAYTFVPLVSSMCTNAFNRINWSVALRCYGDSRIVYYIQSASSAAGEIGYGFASLKFASGVNKIALVLDAGDAGNQNVTLYSNNRSSAQTISRAVTSGTMGGSEALVWQSGMECAKVAHKASNAELDAWFADDTIPATDREFVFAGGHEIDPAAPVIWDTSGNATPLDLTATQITNWQAPAMSADFTDDPGDPVTPFQPFTITPNSVGTFTITARRRRQGVPDRATDEEKYETTSETFTITEMPAEVVQYVRLLITTSTQGTVDIASSDPAVVTFPSSVVVGPTLQYEVLGTVVGAGTSIITTSMGGAVLDTTTVTIEDTPTVIEAGPNQDVRTKLL